jgi:hypothetical protein
LCSDETCANTDRWDENTLEPVGPECGRTPTQVIFWKDGRYSPACGQHGLSALDADVVVSVLCVHPIEPAIVVDATEVEGNNPHEND